MANRARILEAAARVYAKHGFRGATTRLIAIEAGVNEVTLFRTFGSKGALMQEVLSDQDVQSALPTLPPIPGDPAGDLTAFVQGYLQKLREIRPLLVQAMSEFEQRPEAADFSCRGRNEAHEALLRYVEALSSHGIAAECADAATAVAMLSGTIMSDVFGRPMSPDAYPPMDVAAERYVRCFLRMLGVAGAASAAAPRTRSA